ncbi:YcjF family protein [Nannocystis punicea]|uniref:DUF697 domain-containing protein n=1 Tax=Nannocystis punicea TaxID=2995304 RepID=A0ABY7HBH0_9BACT|nr:DUF697 domain-containing protein [Nannocystis poenicansa]WAS96626.1 DUF697 domain-containing protein [Nannocystis poenicansa]
MSADNEKSTQAAKIVRSHMFGSVAAGIVPIPLLDIGILGGVQLRMVRKLAELYDVEFSEQRTRVLLSSLVGVGLAGTAGSVLKMLAPGAAKALFGLGSLAVGPATTYAIGQVFIKHFESGGTIWTFDASRAKEDYDEELEQGQRVVEETYAGIRP